MIPLAEVKFVKTMNEVDTEGAESLGHKLRKKGSPSFCMIFPPRRQHLVKRHFWAGQNMMSKNMDDDLVVQSPGAQAGDKNRKLLDSESISRFNEKKETKISDSNKTKFMHGLQISTVDDGYNSGRSYYFKAQSDELCQEIVSSLQIISKAARKRAQAWSWFRRAQSKVRRVNDSTPFQLGVAFLIITVRCLKSWFVD